MIRAGQGIVRHRLRHNSMNNYIEREAWLMTNHRKFDTTDIANIAALSIASGEADYSREREMAKVSERFLHSAALLPENEILGLQISAGSEGKITGFAFSSPGIKASVEDFDWIFKSYGTAENNKSAEVRDLYEGDRKVYMLRSVQGTIKYTSSVRKKDSYLYTDDDYDDTTSSSYFAEMFTMLMEKDAVVRIIAGSGEENAPGHGMILISLPEEMTLRMRTIISLVFLHMAAVEVNHSEESEAEKLLPDGFLLDGMTRFLFSLICREAKGAVVKKEGEDEMEFLILDDEDSDEKSNSDNESAFTPIEDLELSVRSYNCLKRAGIHSLEELRKMTDEDFMHVRNLGKKSVDEIKQKLAETEIIAAPVPKKAESYMDMLDDLIGLADVKEQIRKIAAFARMKKAMAANGNDNLSVALNMEFVGNPGTAKTTVARIAAGIFNEIGLLPGNGLVEVGRADLVAKYEGQTASKVKEVFRKAKGKVLFIDEAYSLVENWEGEFGDEAINTIVQEMENNREDTIVIFAGYPEKMESFFARNPGLRSRVPFSIAFKDYSADELLQIAELEANSRGFSISSQARDKVLSICNSAAGKAECGNGRFCRNLIENAIMGYASRSYGVEIPEPISNFELSEKDFSDTYAQKKTIKNPIGFCTNKA